MAKTRMVGGTAIRSHGNVESHPFETYGSGRVIVRIGNGGAGATGLIQALANDYLRSRPDNVSIQWICNHSRNTQLALLQGHIDLALTYERDQEEQACSEGWAHTSGCIFHDHFCLVGPASDPANIGPCSTIYQALQKMAKQEDLFHSRADFSATMFKERKIWMTAGLSPWTNKTAWRWYRTSVLGPADALIKADQEGAYLLMDRATLLRQVELGTLKASTVFFEPGSSGDMLMNSCHALYSPLASPETKDEVQAFLRYLSSPQGQGLIAAYGKGTVGLPLFAPSDDGIARTSLVGGHPEENRWKGSSKQLDKARL